jgi:hypothetical protein
MKFLTTGMLQFGGYALKQILHTFWKNNCTVISFSYYGTPHGFSSFLNNFFSPFRFLLVFMLLVIIINC